MSSTTPKSIPARIHGVLAGFGLATALLILLMVLTWFATLEQTINGVHPTLDKYFHFSKWYVFPDAAVFSKGLEGQEKKLPPLPGGFWVCALLVLNLILGGLIRIRKGWRTIGVLMAHFGIVFMVIAGGVAQLTEERGVMMLNETPMPGLPAVSDYALSQTMSSVEILEVQEIAAERDGKEVKIGKPVGEVQVIRDSWYNYLEIPHKAWEERNAADHIKHRIVRLPKLPFDLELTAYLRNGKPMSTSSMAPERGEVVVDGWFLFSQKTTGEAETDTPAIHARVLNRDGSKGEPFLLAIPDPMDYNGLGAPPRDPFTVRADGKTFLIRMERTVSKVPFQVRLVDARSEIYPNTTKPKKYESDIKRIDGNSESDVFVEMNQPMRYGGWTLYQHTMSNFARAGEATVSGFEVVKNPSDQWPKYSIYLAGFGLCLHFIMKLWTFLSRGKGSSSAKS